MDVREEVGDEDGRNRVNRALCFLGWKWKWNKNLWVDIFVQGLMFQMKSLSSSSSSLQDGIKAAIFSLFSTERKHSTECAKL